MNSEQPKDESCNEQKEGNKEEENPEEEEERTTTKGMCSVLHAINLGIIPQSASIMRTPRKLRMSANLE